MSSFKSCMLHKPICPGLRNQGTLLQLMNPDWNNPANESLEVSFWGLCNVSAGAEFVYTLPVSSFTNFRKHIDKFPSCFGSASINHPTNSTNISPGLLQSLQSLLLQLWEKINQKGFFQMASSTTPVFIKQCFSPHSSLAALPPTFHKQFFLLCSALDKVTWIYAFPLEAPLQRHWVMGPFIILDFCVSSVVTPCSLLKSISVLCFCRQQVPSFPGPTHPPRAAHMSNDHSMKT